MIAKRFPLASSTCLLTLMLLGATAEAQGSSLWRITGGEYQSLAVLGDVSGDGVADLATGSTGRFTSSGSGPQRVEIVSGADGAILFTIAAPAGTRWFGASVAAAGDLDGDGTHDLLVGDPFSGFGRVFAFSGRGGAPLFSIGGRSSGGGFGAAMVSAGDVDGDGVVDLLVGAPYADVGASLGVGEVLLLSGATRAVLRTWSGTGQVDSFGASLANLGDLDGDGTAEFAVGATQPGTGGSRPPYTLAGPGYVEVYNAATGALLYSLASTQSGDAFGHALAPISDVNGDGTGDLVVGAPQIYPCSDETCFAGPGYAQIISGRNGALLHTLPGGGAAGDAYGAAVADAGDVNGDGVPDVIAGAPGWDSQTVLPPGYAALCCGKTGKRLFVLKSTVASVNEFGRSVAGPGDVDGDGFPDVVVTDADAAIGILGFRGFVETFSFVAVPAGSRRVGSGCAGLGGETPAIAAFGGAPNATAGNLAFGLSLGGSPAGAQAVLLVAIAANPTGLSFGGCRLHLAGPLFSAGSLFAGPGGRRFAGVPIPVAPALAGHSLSFQWLVVDAASPNGVFTTSEALVVSFL